MVDLAPKCSIMKEIEKTELAVNRTYDVVVRLEKLIQQKDISNEKRESFETELEETKKLLEKYREILQNLHSNNRHSFKLAFFILLIFISLVVILRIYTDS